MDRTCRVALSTCFILVALVTSVGCKTTLDKGEVIGSWESRRGVRVSCVDIRHDGTYSQVIVKDGKTEFSSTSSWSWELKGGEGMGILFERFHHLTDDGSAIKQPPGLWLVVPECTVPFGSPKLVVSDDEGIAYTRSKSPCASLGGS